MCRNRSARGVLEGSCHPVQVSKMEPELPLAKTLSVICGRAPLTNRRSQTCPITADRENQWGRLNYCSHFNRIPHLFSAGFTCRPRAAASDLVSLYIDRVERHHEENIPAQRFEAQAHPRFPFAHGNQEWPPGTEPPPRQRSQAPRRLI